MGQYSCVCKSLDCYDQHEEGDSASITPVVLREETDSLYQATGPQIVQKYENAKAHGGKLRKCGIRHSSQPTFPSPPTPDTFGLIGIQRSENIEHKYENVMSTHSETTFKLLDQQEKKLCDDPVIVSEWHSSEPTFTPPPTPNIFPRSEYNNYKKKHMKAMMQEFRSEALSGIACKVYHKEDDVFALKHCTMSMDEDTSAVKLSLHNCDQFLELPLVTMDVFDYKQLKNQSSFLDNDLAEAFHHDSPHENLCHALHLSVFLVSPEKTHCIVLKDQRMMKKCKLALQSLSVVFREKALKDKISGA